MSEAVREALLAQYTKTLKLPAVAREYPSLARQARQEGCDYTAAQKFRFRGLPT